MRCLACRTDSKGLTWPGNHARIMRIVTNRNEQLSARENVPAGCWSKFKNRCRYGLKVDGKLFGTYNNYKFIQLFRILLKFLILEKMKKIDAGFDRGFISNNDLYNVCDF